VTAYDPAHHTTRFDTVLVANRGEIALRVIRACATAGLRSVAVYSDPDRDAPHVRAADAAVRIGPAPAAESYLSIGGLLEAAARTGAGAIHPGYGFLSEQETFARAVTDAGLTFVGPPAAVMEAMGRKDRAREVALATGVPVVPAATASSASDLDAVAREVGFPLLVKAAAGGGGKGMRIVRARAELGDAVAAARREARAAFGDDTMIFERFVEGGRHIEVQVLADEYGHVVHLFERDCSVQRRHQKVIEEAPSVVISPPVRELVSSAAVALASKVGYVNAGTVEFLVAGDDAYFLEMNTRLQVEHPVTELVTGLDLVELQLSVAQGHPLPFEQGDLGLHGHAIEARVYAEDPAHGFLPQAGTAQVVSWPAQVRVDAALESGQLVGTSYDPMLGKVIAFGPTREVARKGLVRALDETVVIGLTTNVGFLRSLADSVEFRDSAIDTQWLDEHPEVTHVDVPEQAWVLAACALARSGSSIESDPLALADGWRLAGPPAPVSVSLTSPDAGETRLLEVAPGEETVRVADRSLVVRDGGWADGRLRLEIAGELVAGHVVVESHRVLVAYRGQTWIFELPDPFASGTRLDASDGRVAAPMPGTVLVVNVAAGQEVEEGQALGVIEAMKMELALKAPFAGRVGDVRATAGSQVDLGATLFVIEPSGVEPSGEES
jgi:3-methylcrotonyl-CoA carboxylase alpha subunit/acetyl-CoA/propionyl-CoA carboxylase biotin carboxyl carrier protein